MDFRPTMSIRFHLMISGLDSKLSLADSPDSGLSNADSFSGNDVSFDNDQVSNDFQLTSTDLLADADRSSCSLSLSPSRKRGRPDGVCVDYPSSKTPLHYLYVTTVEEVQKYWCSTFDFINFANVPVCRLSDQVLSMYNIWHLKATFPSTPPLWDLHLSSLSESRSLITCSSVFPPKPGSPGMEVCD